MRRDQRALSSEEILISESITPVLGTMDVSAMTRGEPGLPGKFIWRGKEYEVAEVIEQWKDTGPCWSGSGERYVRKHWFRVKTTDGSVMKFYFERQARSRALAKKRWWLHSVIRKAS
jgi:phosphoribosylglycinamide formyltransferase-1